MSANELYVFGKLNAFPLFWSDLMPLHPTHLELDANIEYLVAQFQALESRQKIARLRCTTCKAVQLRSMKMQLLFGSEEDTDSDGEN